MLRKIKLKVPAPTKQAPTQEETKNSAEETMEEKSTPQDPAKTLTTDQGPAQTNQSPAKQEVPEEDNPFL